MGQVIQHDFNKRPIPQSRIEKISLLLETLYQKEVLELYVLEESLIYLDGCNPIQMTLLNYTDVKVETDDSILVDGEIVHYYLERL